MATSKKIPARRKAAASAPPKPEPKKPSSAPTPKEPVKAEAVEEKEQPKAEPKAAPPKAVAPKAQPKAKPIVPPPPAPVEDDEAEDFSMLGGAESAFVTLMIGASCTTMGMTFTNGRKVTVTDKQVIKQLMLDGCFSVELKK